MHRLLLTFGLAALVAACSASGVDSTTASFEGTIGDRCESAHECSANQRCVGRVCELAPNGCLANTDCGSNRCESGFCSLPAPALLADNPQAGAAGFVGVGYDGLVDRRGGLVMSLGTKVDVRDGNIYWGSWKVLGWRAETPSPRNWGLVEGTARPERFRLQHVDTKAELVIMVRPLRSQDRPALQLSLRAQVDHIATALKEGVPFHDAVALVGEKAQVSTPIERTSYRAAQLDTLQAIRFETLRHEKVGGKRIRMLLSRLEFGGTHFVAVVALVAPMDEYTGLLDDFTDVTGLLRFAGIDANVDMGSLEAE